MNRVRWLVMLLAPVPIVAGSMALSKLARSERPRPPATNDVVVRAQGPDRPAAVVLVAETAPVEEELARQCRARGKQIGANLGNGCQTFVAAPFVIAGDMTDEELQAWYERTIRPAAQAMAHRYFAKRPDRPITVLLFRSKESYEHYAEKLYRDRGISIYGYYKPRERTLVMNIATGGGTLVHELTHALIAFDCPEVPDLFNEGLASLHEQCRFREDDRGPWIEGLVNWRLPDLQKELTAGRLRTLEDLIGSDDFRGERETLNYAQARYFCLFLQERRLLDDFYQALKTSLERDPRGAAAVQAVFPDKSWRQVEDEYRAFVRKLKAGS